MLCPHRCQQRRPRRVVSRCGLAFSLVELLAVIAIISVLAAMLFPTMEQAIAETRKVVCANNLRQLGAGAAMYTQECNDWLPPADIFLNGFIVEYARNDAGSAQMREAVAKYGLDYGRALNLAKLYELDYVEDVLAFFCPNDPKRASLGYYGLAATQQEWPFCAGGPWSGQVWYSYTYNPYGAFGAYNFANEYCSYEVAHPTFPRLSRFPATRPIAMDAVTGKTWNGAFWHEDSFNLLFPDMHVAVKETLQSHYWLVLWDLTGKNGFQDSTYLHGE